MTSREELVAVEGETYHPASMPFHLIQVLVGPEDEALEHALHGALVQRVVLPQLLGMQPLLLEDPQQQVSLPQSQLSLHSLRLEGSRMHLPTLASNTPQPRAPRRTSDRASPLRPRTLLQHSSDCPARPHRTHS